MINKKDIIKQRELMLNDLSKILEGIDDTNLLYLIEQVIDDRMQILLDKMDSE